MTTAVDSPRSLAAALALSDFSCGQSDFVSAGPGAFRRRGTAPAGTLATVGVTEPKQPAPTPYARPTDSAMSVRAPQALAAFLRRTNAHPLPARPLSRPSSWRKR